MRLPQPVEFQGRKHPKQYACGFYAGARWAKLQLRSDERPALSEADWRLLQQEVCGPFNRRRARGVGGRV